MEVQDEDPCPRTQVLVYHSVLSPRLAKEFLGPVQMTVRVPWSHEFQDSASVALDQGPGPVTAQWHVLGPVLPSHGTGFEGGPAPCASVPTPAKWDQRPAVASSGQRYRRAAGLTVGAVWLVQQRVLSLFPWHFAYATRVCTSFVLK